MPSLDHILFNPNQLRHFGSLVQDNPYGSEPMVIQNPDRTFTACLQSEGTDIFITTWAPSTTDLNKYPHVVLSSSNPWNPRGVKLPSISTLEQEEIEGRNICGVQTMEETEIDRKIGHEQE